MLQVRKICNYICFGSACIFFFIRVFLSEGKCNKTVYFTNSGKVVWLLGLFTFDEHYWTGAVWLLEQCAFRQTSVELVYGDFSLVVPRLFCVSASVWSVKFLCQVRINEESPSAENPWFREWYMEKYQCNLAGITRYARQCSSLYPSDPDERERQKRLSFVQVSQIITTWQVSPVMPGNVPACTPVILTRGNARNAFPSYR